MKIFIIIIIIVVILINKYTYIFLAWFQFFFYSIDNALK